MSLWDKLRVELHTCWVLNKYKRKGRACDGYDGSILCVAIDYDKARITVYGPPPSACPTLIRRLASLRTPKLTAGTETERK